MPVMVPPQEHLGRNTFDSLRPHGLQRARLLCLWDSPGKTTGVGSHFFLQGIFSIQASNLHLLHYWWILYLLSHRGSPLDTQSGNSPGQNTGVGSLSLLQGIFPAQGLNPGLSHCRWILYQLSY